MKKLMLCAMLMGCSPVVNTLDAPTTPKGYKTCFNDSDCAFESEYCGFKGVNTTAVCLPDHNIKQ